MNQNLNDPLMATDQQYLKEANRSMQFIEILLLLNLIAWPVVGFIIYIYILG